MDMIARIWDEVFASQGFKVPPGYAPNIKAPALAPKNGYWTYTGHPLKPNDYGA